MLTIFVQHYFEGKRTHRERRSLAFILELEIETIKRLAKLNIEINKEAVSKAREAYDSPIQGKDARGILIVDADLPISSFERVNVNLGLFDEETASSVAELYRIVDIIHYNKKLNQSYFQEGQKIIQSISMGGAINESQRAMAFMHYGNSILFAESYISTLEVIVKLCDEALRNLSKYRKFDPEDFKIEISKQTRIQGHEEATE